MLQVQNLRKSFGVHTVLDGASFIINKGEHVGLIGPNGSGKSTILRIITRQDPPDSGSIMLSPADLTIGYLPQSFDASGDLTVSQAMSHANAELLQAEQLLQQASEALTSSTDLESALADYTDALARFEALGGYEREHQSSAILQGLGLGDIAPDTIVSTLSGGQKTRLGLATLLVRQPDLLLLDEPTNHLDVEALEWLESFVQSYRGAALIVSHDRHFLDRTVTRILYLDPRTHTVKSYPGTYTDFADAREREREAHIEAWKRQQEYVAKTRADISRIKGQAQAIEASTMGGHRATPKTSEEKYGNDHVRRLARKKAQLAKSRERKLERYMQSEERVEKPGLSWLLKLDFGPTPAGGRSVLRIEDVEFAYPGHAPLLTGVTFDVQHGDRVALVGPNGAGKTTLLRLIDGTLQPQRGQVRLGPSVKLGRLAQEGETLDRQRTVLQTALHERPMSETDARSFLHFFLFQGDDVFRKVGECSLGERTRLQLALLVLGGCNLLLLDEPLNHLDIEGREHFEHALDAFQGTVIAVAHDRAFLQAYPERIIEVRDGNVRPFEGGWEDYLRATGR